LTKISHFGRLPLAKREGERMVWNGKEGAKKGVAAGESVSERA